MINKNLKTQSLILAFRGDGSPSPAEIAANVAAILQKNNNDANKSIEMLLSETAKLREDKRALKEELQRWKDDAPQHGDVILSGEEIKEWEKYLSFGTAEDVEKKVSGYSEMESKIQSIEKKSIVEEAAKLSGFNPNVLHKLGLDLEIEFKEVPKTDALGKTTNQKVAFIKTDAGLESLHDYASKNWNEFMPSLKEGANTQNRNSGVKYHSNGSGGQVVPPEDIAENFIKQANEARSKGTNPLMPTTTGA